MNTYSQILTYAHTHVKKYNYKQVPLNMYICIYIPILS